MRGFYVVEVLDELLQPFVLLICELDVEVSHSESPYMVSR